MDLNNPLYKNQGIHVVLSLFTVDNGKLKVFLIKRKNEPFKGKWILIGGACYNNETVDAAMEREMFEKTGIQNVKYNRFDVFSNPDRSPLCRMLAVGYVGVMDKNRVKYLKETAKTGDADWFMVDRVPALGYDHEEILQAAIDYLRIHIFDSDILKELFPKHFTLPELHKAYESILGKKLDRRNFRKRLLQQNIIEDVGLMEENAGKKPSKLYRFV
ncbi:MAG: NUDIX hydrolase [Clostridia bacterium]|nr:NUDIX hydrolase [Clostridia bacterium]